MDGFGWSTQQTPPGAASCPKDDALLAAFLGGASTTFELLHSAAAGISDDAYGHELPPSCQDDDILRRLLRCRDSVNSPLPSAVDVPSKAAILHNSAGSLRAPAPPIGQHDSSFAFFPNAGDAFSGHSTATGNISSGDSNTHDAEVASPPCIVPATRTTTGTEAMAQAKQEAIIYRAAAAAYSSSPAAAAGADPPLGPRRRRRNVRISSEPQTVAARLRREKVSERLRALRRLVPGGGSGKMDTASMLHQAACYLSFLKAQLARFQAMAAADGRASYSSNSSSMQRYDNPPESLGGGNIGNGGAVLSFRRDDSVDGYVRGNNWNMQSL
ncbi:uncharacterized protein LOC106866126 [Brachypodium distachyon]|uniref:BHLH domain-containing protein n=1 Tax=Brachypodium distachyon TaxID=15368 RepID=I1HH13_BRADI|nr:uncharacterized protein LOC106866126 [Brachypodium distachyon]KQK05129.1 hypothetical protein BRADI_2g18200v3 [Brachypodium distachyon]|eukprot:XP_014754355.1 uncharacterized protein LOC106866126 [Brachypodium distachyon]